MPGILLGIVPGIHAILGITLYTAEDMEAEQNES